MSLSPEQAKAYWRANLRLMLTLLSVWFISAFICSIVLVDFLNHFRLAGYKLGFWFAQQGSMYIFVILIFYYAKKMRELDKKFKVNEE